MRFFDRQEIAADSRNKSQPPVSRYEPRRLLNHPVNTENFAIKDPTEIRNTLYRETVTRKQAPLVFSQYESRIDTENVPFQNSVMNQSRSQYLSGVKGTFENSFSLASMRSLKDVDIANSPSYLRKKANGEAFSHLLDSLMPTNDFEPDQFAKKDPNFNLKPNKSALVNSDGSFMKRSRNFQKKPVVAFDEQPRVVEVENWKLFNVDTAKTKSQVQTETGQKNCTVF